MTSGGAALIDIDLPLPHLASGKVRELYALADHLLFVATDRISAFDVIMRQGIPSKGRVLTAMTVFWLDLVSDICPHHLISTDIAGDPALAGHQEELLGRSMVVKKLEMLPVEFVVRGYLAGSGWKEYRSSGSVCGIPLPAGLLESGRLPEPIFTPTTKASAGHDLPLTEDQAADLCGPDALKRAKDAAIAIYERAASTAAERGIILADTKFEFGTDNNDEVVLADEVLTPDSSRFWPASEWKPGGSPPSFDKQYLRDWLDSQGWDHEPPPPDLPDEVVGRTRTKYVEAFEILTGATFGD